MFSLPYPSKPRPAYAADVEIGIGIGYGHAVGHGHAAIAGSRIPGVFLASYHFVPFGLVRLLTACVDELLSNRNSIGRRKERQKKKGDIGKARQRDE